MKSLLLPGLTLCFASGVLLAAAPGLPSAQTQVFKQYCFTCHSKSATAGINLEQMAANPSIAENFAKWQKVAAVLEEKRMPPFQLPQPSDADRAAAAGWVRASLKDYAVKHDGDPGGVTVRRLTSAEYGYTVQDLTGLELNFNGEFAGDAVGGEGFANFGDVQFVSDASLERYVETAKKIADHAVIGAGPLEFFEHPGKTGFELAAVNRIKDIYAKYGFRTVSGEGGRPFGLDKYGKAFFVAWEYRNRAALGEPGATLETFAAREGLTARWAQHIWKTFNSPALGYPSSEVVARWKKLPTPTADRKASEVVARTGCEDIEKFITTWPSWLFARGDVAAGGQGDESPLIISDATLKGEPSHRFVYPLAARGGAAAAAGGGRGRGAAPAGPTRIYLKVNSVNPNAIAQPVVIWRNAVIGNRVAGARPANAATADPAAAAVAANRQFQVQSTKPLREVLSKEWVSKLNFGHSPDGTPMGPDDFATTGEALIELPEGAAGPSSVFQATAEVGADRNTVVRIIFSNREDGRAAGIPTRALLGDPQSTGYKAFKSGVMEMVALMPPNAFGEPTPADKDPAPEPFDSTFNTPEHDEWVNRAKYRRDDRFIYNNVLDDATRVQLDQAWSNLYASFDYHDNYLDMLAKKFKVDLKVKHISELNEATVAALPADARKYIAPLVAEYQAVQRAQRAARPRHVEDCLSFAALAWRRPLTEAEKESLRAFYTRARTGAEMDHDKAIRALLARVLVSPAFLYRIERPSEAAAGRPLSNWEMASRLSYFLWSSMPDAELRRAAAAGELTTAAQLEKQVKRMMADDKARRFATEFFGQWLGFYRFDQHKGVDTTRFPEFTQEVKEAMYDESVSFFDYIVRKDRPSGEILTADYTFLNQALAKHYGVTKEVKSTGDPELVEGANAFHRGGMLRLGSVLTATSAPLRTSPVKRGDWVLRRILGTPTPPPPPDAGSIPADDKLFAGLSLRDKLAAHKRNATCAGCHTRIDPMGFPLEHYDSTGRWRETYADGKPVDDSSATTDGTQIAGVDGLQKYLLAHKDQVLHTMSRKLVGYALGRTVLPSDEVLIDKLTVAGTDATFSQLAAEIVKSKQFRYRREKEEAPAAAPPPSQRAAAGKTGQAGAM